MNIFGLIRQEYDRSLVPVVGLTILSGLLLSWMFSLLAHAAASYDLREFSLHPNIFIISFFLWVLTSRLQQRVMNDMTETVLHHSRMRVLTYIRNMRLQDFERLGKSSIYNTLTYDMKLISDATMLLPSLMADAIMFVGGLLYLAYVSLEIAGIVLITMIVCALLYLWHQQRIQYYAKINRRWLQRVFESTRHHIYGFKELKLNDHKNDDFYHRNYLKTLERAEETHNLNGLQLDKNYLMALSFWIVLLLIVIFLMPALGAISKEVMIAAVSTLLYLPIWRLMETVPLVTLANISVQHLHDLEIRLRQFRSESVISDASQRIPSINTIQLEDFTFDYSDQTDQSSFAIGPLNLTIAGGKITFIVGGNGSGKSTLAKLLTGLYLPHSGNLKLNGKIIAPGTQREWFSAVFTDFHLFHRMLDATSVDDERVTALLHQMELDHKTTYTDGQFTETELSDGQKRRLALIVALLEDRPICIFDEWAADQDPKFRDYFYLQILPQLRDAGKTVIVVSHDDRYYHVADDLLKMEMGQIIV